MSFLYSSSSHQGDRAYQEDSCLWLESADQQSLGFVLSDGMGGHAAGDLASQTLVNTYAQTFNTRGFSGNVVESLAVSLQEGNNQIQALIQDGTGTLGMGATYLAGVVSRDRVNWISVGDSPLYLFRKAKIKQINEDHSMTPIFKEQVATGELTQDEAAKHPRRDDLYSAVMGGQIEEIDQPTAALPLHIGDIIIAASDGIQVLDETEMEVIINQWVNSGYKGCLCQRLIEAVLQKKHHHQDNVTVMAVALVDVGN